MTEAPLFWLQHIENALQVVSEVPLWGSPPPFPWEKCSEQIAALFQLDDLKITHKQTHFLKAEDLASGLGANPIKTPIDLSPVQGSAFWLLSSEDVAKFTQLILAPQNSLKGFASAQFQEGFYRYLLLNILEQIDQLKAFDDLSIKLGASQSIPQEDSLCIDVAISHPKMTLWGRLICPPAFHQAFKQHFSQRPLSLINSPAAKTIDLSLKLEIGQSTLTYAQWKTVETGDVIILDRCAYDPHSHKGTVTLVLEQAPLFRARLKENHLKIVEYAYYHEEEKSMEHNLPEDENPDIPHEEEGYETPPSDMGEEISEETDEHLWSPGAQHEDIEKMVSAQTVPLTLSVEVARLKINLDKLLQLKPGNLIELPVKPEQGVDIVLNGKKVAKGELIKLGEALGVKILQIGN
ncbi:MAG: type III secretion system cytoplasmic ring protein SctQ [Parachlamydiales bacterium]|nr:type III secretion system cytoplasmic ring protein SctQ [Candidatus Acheromyda pituitae]